MLLRSIGSQVRSLMRCRPKISRLISPLIFTARIAASRTINRVIPLLQISSSRLDLDKKIKGNDLTTRTAMAKTNSHNLQKSKINTMTDSNANDLTARVIL